LFTWKLEAGVLRLAVEPGGLSDGSAARTEVPPLVALPPEVDVRG
jgi:hypothetical protein